MIDAIKLGNRIRSLREKSKLTQSQVAMFLGVDQSLVSKYEKGDRSISSDVIESLCDLFCCPLDNLLSEDVSEIPVNIAFRTSDLTAKDLEDLTVINRIALNQMKMDEIQEKRGSR